MSIQPIHGTKTMRRKDDASGPRFDCCGMLTVLVPVFNEAKTFGLMMERLVARSEVGQIIVVDDGSTDATAQHLEEWAGHQRVRVIRHSINRGKGAAIRSGLSLATCNWVIVQDADLEYDPGQFPYLLQPILRGEADVVYGVRYQGKSCVYALVRDGLDAFLGLAAVQILNALLRWIYGLKTTDEATCYKVFRVSDLRRMCLQCEGFEFCPEVSAKLGRLKLRFAEVPIQYTRRSRKDGKKIRCRDLFIAIRTLWRYRNWSYSRPPM